MSPPAVPESLKELFSRVLLPDGMGAPPPKWREPFPHPLDEKSQFERDLTTERELTMRRIVDKITDKPNWTSKVQDWCTNYVSHCCHQLKYVDGLDISRDMVHYLDEELHYLAEHFEKTGLISVYDGDIVKSDSAIPESLKVALQAAAVRLEDVSESERDWHPGTDGQVLDLVHPSLFPVVFGLTRVVADRELSIEEGLARSGNGVILPKFNKELGHHEPAQHDSGGSENSDHSSPEDPWENGSKQYSRDYQWMPCEVKFRPTEEAEDGEEKESFRCEITSYINNLHPDDHKELYSIIEQVLTRTIPLWNATLGPLEKGEYPVRIGHGDVQYTIDFENLPKDLLLKNIIKEHGDGKDENEDIDEEEELDRQWEWEMTLQKHTLILPEPGNFEEPKDWSTAFKLQERYAEKGLQVIVKMANIHLTPEKPEYPGGTWHIEGQLNERICATALYYYDSSNITDSYLAFRQFFSWDIDVAHPNNHRLWLKRIFGVEENQPCVQDVGTINCREGRLLTFPNIFQHQVQPFKLEDSSKPGHRKILALFLVDPNVRVLSSANVPVQRKDWRERMMGTDDPLRRLPLELKLMVEKFVGEDEFPIDMEKAKDIRERLMAERKSFKLEGWEKWSHDNISLCEH